MITKREQRLIDYLDKVIERDRAIYHTQPAARDPLHDAMTATDWTPARDMYGHIVSWTHSKTGHTVKHSAVLTLWRECKAVPPPF